MTHIRRASCAVVLVFLHLLITPCATAMMLMPADMDCEHCQTINNPDACAVASAETDIVIAGVAFDSGRADPPVLASQFSLLVPVQSPGPLTVGLQSRFVATYHSGDPPLYLQLGQLRL